MQGRGLQNHHGGWRTPQKRRFIMRSRQSPLGSFKIFSLSATEGGQAQTLFEALSTRHPPTVINGFAPLTRASKKLEVRGNSLVPKAEKKIITCELTLRQHWVIPRTCLLPSRLQMTQPAASTLTHPPTTTTYTPQAATPPPSTSVLGKHGRGIDTSSKTCDIGDDGGAAHSHASGLRTDFDIHKQLS